MIIIKLKGGLGNQMFQYALGRSLSLKHKQKLFFDISDFKNDKLRDFDLDCFSLDINIADEKILKRIKKQFATKKTIFNFSCSPKCNVIVEKECPFYYEKFLITQKCNYFDGYWQYEEYFREIRNILLSDFTFKIELNTKILNLLETIKSQNSIGIHIRRGDYIDNAKTNNFHGVCNLDYYYKAIQILASKISFPSFFIFSDDINWAKNNLKTNYPLYFAENNTYEDLFLLQNCKHFIIANSSYSWWGAWLASNKDKTVIAPLRWFANENANQRFSLPNEWLRI